MAALNAPWPANGLTVKDMTARAAWSWWKPWTWRKRGVWIVTCEYSWKPPETIRNSVEPSDLEQRVAFDAESERQRAIREGYVIPRVTPEMQADLAAAPCPPLPIEDEIATRTP